MVVEYNKVNAWDNPEGVPFQKYWFDGDFVDGLIRRDLDMYGGGKMPISVLCMYYDFLYRIYDMETRESVGYMFSKLSDDGVYHIYELEIFREYRGKGYARDLLKLLNKVRVYNVIGEKKSFWRKMGVRVN